MRIRTIKPEFWQNEKLSSLPAETHMLAAALLNYADDEGYFNANPKLIQGQLFPVRELSGSIPVMLQQLSTEGGISYLEVRISSDGRAYGWVINFDLHQVVNKPRESVLKPLFDACCKTGANPSTTPNGALPESSGSTTGGNGMEGKGSGMEREQGKARGARGRDGAESSSDEATIRQRMEACNGLTNRKAATKWSAKEIAAFKSAGLDRCSADDFAEQLQPLLTYYAAPLPELRIFWGTTDAKDFRRRDLLTVLSNWGSEVDRATKYCEHAQKKADEANKGRL